MFQQWRHLWNAGAKRPWPEQLGLRQAETQAFVTRQAMCWEADTHKPKKGSPQTLCRKALSSVTLGYFQPHLHTGITTVSTVSSLTTKDNSDKSQCSLNWKIALLTTVDARFSIVNRASQVIYAATTCIRSPPSFSCFPGTCQNESETVVSSNMSYIAWTTTGTGVPKHKLKTSYSANHSTLACLYDSLGSLSMASNDISFFILETWKTFQKNKSLYEIPSYACKDFWRTCTRRLLYAYTNKWHNSMV